jgi:hypothetical protein
MDSRKTQRAVLGSCHGVLCTQHGSCSLARHSVQQLYNLPELLFTRGSSSTLCADYGTFLIEVYGAPRLIVDSKEKHLMSMLGCCCRIPFPIKSFSPSGYIDTLYLDDDLRISKGDKGSIFVARRAQQTEQQQQ